MRTPEEYDQREARITATFVVLAAFAVFCAIVSQVRGEGFSVSVESASLFTVTVDQPKSEALPEMLFFYADFKCDPCDRQKADVKNWKNAPFKMRTPAKCPIPITSYPMSVWKVGNTWWHIEGWDSREHLVREWKKSFEKKKAFGSGITPSILKKFARTYQGPLTGVKGNNFWWHLQEHGFTAAELNGLSQRDCEMIHGALHHYGYTVPQIRRYLQTH